MQPTILKVTLALIFLINLWGAIPPFRYAPWEDMKRDDVRVYTRDSSSGV